MAGFGKDLGGIGLRVSDASTQDFESDQETGGHRVLEFTEEEACLIFNPIPQTQKEIYQELSLKLKALYEVLEQEIEPCCIRDDLTLAGNQINLNSITFSRLSKRRFTSK